ncbi:hypothetical protein ABZ023_18290 [Streptomyces sp. NPDC006367]|uniref:hypothetical protein n=1 Tax=unclassified Streptomyces TaxID=2593676 RepID=UPI0033BE4D07
MISPPWNSPFFNTNTSETTTSRPLFLLLSDLAEMPNASGYVEVSHFHHMPGVALGGDPAEFGRTPDGQLWVTGRARIYTMPECRGPEDDRQWAQVWTDDAGNLSVTLPDDPTLVALFAINPDTGDGDQRLRGGWYRITEQDATVPQGA